MSKYFKIGELVAPEVLRDVGEEEAWRRLGTIPNSLDLIREDWDGPIRVNSPKRKYCGVRPADCKIGAPNSAHKKWKAFDLHVDPGHTSALHAMIREHHAEYGVRRMERHEYTPSWVHVEFGEGPFTEFTP